MSNDQHGSHSPDPSTSYAKDSLTLLGAVSMGTGVMIGAGIFALTGQVAELAGSLFPLAFIVGAVITAFSAYSYVKMSNAFPSAGGIAMILQKAYGRGTVTGACAILMALSMVINESLVARTFGTYTLQLFDLGSDSVMVPALGVGLILFAFIVNVSGNRIVGTFSFIMAAAKILGIAIFGIASIWVSSRVTLLPQDTVFGTTPLGFIAALALTILAYKGFTTITNSGAELVDPHRNVGRAIIISILICIVVYLLVAFGVGASLGLEEIVTSKNFALAEAAKPALGDIGLLFTVLIAIIATASGLIASVFAVSRMLTMLTDMKLIPHRHFGMTGPLQRHLLVYTVVMAIFLTVFFDLSRIAALGAIFYLIMDIGIHWGVFRYMRQEIGANPTILVAAILLDLVVLGAFVVIKLQTDAPIVAMAAIALAAVFVGEWFYLRGQAQDEHPKR